MSNFLTYVSGTSTEDSFRGCSGQRFDGDSIVCVCNATYCDDLPPIMPEETVAGSFLSYRSSQAGDRYANCKFPKL